MIGSGTVGLETHHKAELGVVLGGGGTAGGGYTTGGWNTGGLGTNMDGPDGTLKGGLGTKVLGGLGSK